MLVEALSKADDHQPEKHAYNVYINPHYWLDEFIPYYEAKFGLSMSSDVNHPLDLYGE